MREIASHAAEVEFQPDSGENDGAAAALPAERITVTWVAFPVGDIYDFLANPPDNTTLYPFVGPEGAEVWPDIEAAVAATPTEFIAQDIDLDGDPLIDDEAFAASTAEAFRAAPPLLDSAAGGAAAASSFGRPIGLDMADAVAPPGGRGRAPAGAGRPVREKPLTAAAKQAAFNVDIRLAVDGLQAQHSTVLGSLAQITAMLQAGAGRGAPA